MKGRIRSSPTLHGLAVLVGDDRERQRLEHHVVVVQSQADLFEVVAALRSPSRLSGRLNGRQQESATPQMRNSPPKIPTAISVMARPLSPLPAGLGVDVSPTAPESSPSCRIRCTVQCGPHTHPLRSSAIHSGDR